MDMNPILFLGAIELVLIPALVIYIVLRAYLTATTYKLNSLDNVLVMRPIDQ
ncbi:hypothetical protein BDV06DRAFT_191926 [Aspergillus oleicola]